MLASGFAIAIAPCSTASRRPSRPDVVAQNFAAPGVVLAGDASVVYDVIPEEAQIAEDRQLYRRGCPSGGCDPGAVVLLPLDDVPYSDALKVAQFMARLEPARAQPTAGWSDPKRISTSATTIRLPNA